MLSENLDLFLTDFSQEALLVSGSTSKSIRVIFDEEYIGMDLGAEGRLVTAMCKSTDAVGANHRSYLQIGNKTYQIQSVRPVGDGQFTELVLKE